MKKSRELMMALVCTLVWTMPVLAQLPAAQVPKSEQKIKPPARMPKVMYEDIEIFRRIMAGKIDGVMQQCQSCHAQNNDIYLFYGDYSRLQSFGPMGSSSRSSAREVWMDNIQGLYLDKVGVIYQLTLPKTLVDIAQGPSISENKEKVLSEWERIRRELHGKPSSKKNATKENPHTLDLVDTMLQLVAKNGTNFSQLGDQEKITIAVTFSSGANAVKKLSRGFVPANNNDGPFGMMGMPGGGSGMGMSGGPGGSTSGMGLDSGGPGGGISGGGEGGFPGGGSGGFSGSGGGFPGAAPASGQGKDLELLADMQFKQGKREEAIRSYQKSLFSKSDSDSSRARIYRKLGQAYAAIAATEKNQEKYADAAKQAVEWLQKSNSITAKNASKDAPSITLPDRLIISVAKEVMDDFHSGKLSNEQLRSAASIQWLRFSNEGDTTYYPMGESGAPSSSNRSSLAGQPSADSTAIRQ